MTGPFAVSPPPDVQADVRGLRVTCVGAEGGRPFNGLLEFGISCDGSSFIPFSFETTSRAEDSSVFEFRGSFPDPSAGLICRLRLTRLALAGGFVADLEVENSADDLPVRLECRLVLPDDADPQWLIPGLFYGTNRAANSERLYPGYSEIKRDPKRFWANHWSFRSDRASLPVILCTTFSGTAFLAVEEMSGFAAHDSYGATLTSVGLSSEDGRLMMTASLPAVEEPVRAVSSSGDTSPVFGSFLLERGRPLQWRLELGLVPGAATQRERVLRALYYDRWSRHPLRPKVSSLEAERLAIDGLSDWHLDKDRKILRERSLGERDEVDARPFRVGERNGVFPAYVLLWFGRDRKEAAPVRVAHELLDAISTCLAPCGSFYEDFGEPAIPTGGARTARLVHARPVAEAVLFLVRALRLEMQAHTAHPLWSAAVVSNLDFIVSAQREDGAFPPAWNAETGHASSWEGCDGIAWIASLAAAGQVTASQAWLDAARRGALYYRHAVEDSFLTGALEDHEGVPTCAAAHWAVISYILLYEADHDPLWLELARRAADIALTWRMAYNIDFAPASMLAQSGISTFGGDILSVTCPLIGPWGLISYAEMIRLSALTEDEYYEQRAREGRVYASQLLARADGEFNLRRGQTLGPISCTDGILPKGLAGKESLVWINALTAYVELIERNQLISREALSGDRESVVEMALRASSVTLTPDLSLPETAASLRGRESGSPRVPLTVRAASSRERTPISPPSPVPPSSVEESATGSGVQESKVKHSRHRTPHRTSSGVIQMPSFPGEIHEPRRTTDEGRSTDEKPPTPGSTVTRRPNLNVAGTPQSGAIVPDDEPPLPIRPRIPGLPVGKDPVSNQDIFVASTVAASRAKRLAEEREKERQKNNAEKKRDVPVHRGYRPTSGESPPVVNNTPPPERQSYDSVPEKLWVERPSEMPKWHVYQYGLEHVKPLPEESNPAPMPRQSDPSTVVKKLASSDQVDIKTPSKKTRTRQSGSSSKIPLEERHMPLPKPVQPGTRKSGTEAPRGGTSANPSRAEENPLRLPTGFEGDGIESRDPDSAADPSIIKWKIF